MSRPRDFGLRDRMDTTGENYLHCTCGVRLAPDCDVSAASIVEEFQRHLRDAHGFSQAEIEAELKTK